MKRLLLGLPVLLVISCGGGGGNVTPPPPTITISISPTSATVSAGKTQQFTATVNGTSNKAVTWQVNNITGGNSTVGTISTAGLYTAPLTVPNPATVTVKAISQANSTKSAAATVTIPIMVTVSPTTVTVAAATTRQFTSTVNGTSNTAVTWKVNGITGGNSTIGTISTSGLYTAPVTPPATGKVTVTVVSVADSSRSGSATVTDTFSDASFSGGYSYNLSGDDASGTFFGVGSFTADGNGNITNGTQDLNHGTGFMTNLVAFTGTYTVGSDGRGTATLTNTLGATNLQFVLYSNLRARFIIFDANANGRGQILKRNPSAFSASAINGRYSFGFNGSDAGGAPAAAAGRFTANGAGNITAGVEDTNEGGTVTSSLAFTGTYTVDPTTGRGMMTLTTASGDTHYDFHIVASDTLFIVESDYPFPVVAGTGRKQQGTFSNASLNGGYAFQVSGVTPLGHVEKAGRFTANGLGTLSSGAFDQNNAGAVSTNISFTGTNTTIASNGRGTVTLTAGAVGTPHFTVYMVSSTEAFFVETDSLFVANGTVLAQQGQPFTNSSLSGSFGFGVFTRNTDTDQSGQATLDGAGGISGTEDVNHLGALTSDATFTGTYSVSANGRVTATVTPPGGGTAANVVFYTVLGSKLFLIEVDPGSVGSGVVEKQF